MNGHWYGSVPEVCRTIFIAKLDVRSKQVSLFRILMREVTTQNLSLLSTLKRKPDDLLVLYTVHSSFYVSLCEWLVCCVLSPRVLTNDWFANNGVMELI